jgi:hypothetical protein
MDRREIHFCAAGICEALFLKLVAQQISNPPRTRQRRCIVRIFVPEQQSEHDVIMAPRVPCLATLWADVGGAPRQSTLLWPRPKITILRLQRDQPLHEVRNVIS